MHTVTWEIQHVKDVFSTTDIRPQMHAITGCVNLKIIDILKSKVQIHLNIMDGDAMCCKLP